MAIIVNGQISGRVGDLVYCLGKNKRDYVRRVGVIKVPPSEPQLANRKRMAATCNFLTPLRGLIDELWDRRLLTKQTAFGTAFSYMMHYAFDRSAPEPVICYSKILLCRGKLESTFSAGLSRESGMVTVKWANSPYPNSYRCHDEDMAVLVLYFPEKEASLVFRNEAVRRDEKLAVALPGVYAGCSLHAWLIFASRRGLGCSTSLYVEGE